MQLPYPDRQVCNPDIDAHGKIPVKDGVAQDQRMSRVVACLEEGLQRNTALALVLSLALVFSFAIALVFSLALALTLSLSDTCTVQGVLRRRSRLWRRAARVCDGGVGRKFVVTHPKSVLRLLVIMSVRRVASRVRVGE